MPKTMDDRWADVQAYVGECKAITWDTCHKIYVLMDDKQVALMRSYGYDEESDAFFTKSEKSSEEMLALLRKWYEESCFLRFINAVETVEGDPNKGFTTLIEQGAEAYDEDEDDEEFGWRAMRF